MKFNFVAGGEVYIPGNITVIFIESAGENQTIIRTIDHSFLVAHPLAEVIAEVRKAHIEYHTTGTL